MIARFLNHQQYHKTKSPICFGCLEGVAKSLFLGVRLGFCIFSSLDAPKNHREPLRIYWQLVHDSTGQSCGNMPKKEELWFFHTVPLDLLKVLGKKSKNIIRNGALMMMNPMAKFVRITPYKLQTKLQLEVKSPINGLKNGLIHG